MTLIESMLQSVRSELSALLEHGGRIPADVVSGWIRDWGISPDQLLVHLLPWAAGFARAPISGFSVGAVAVGMPSGDAQGEPGAVYFGANQEFPGQPLAMTIHAEQSVVNHAWLHGERGLSRLAVSAAPCGHCRQFLKELAAAETPLTILLAGAAPAGGSTIVHTTVAELLPGAFGPSDLGTAGGLMDPQERALTLPDGNNCPLTAIALKAARESYAPYTKSYGGVAIALKGGRQFSGRYAENAAFNPSLLPLQSALAFANMSLPPQSPLEIQEAVYVEVAGQISHRAVTAQLLSTLAAGARLKCQEAEGGER